MSAYAKLRAIQQSVYGLAAAAPSDVAALLDEYEARTTEIVKPEDCQMKIDPNDPAYPIPEYVYDVMPSLKSVAHATGLTVRAEIAARVMAGFAADPSRMHSKMDEIVVEAVEWADALIAELNKEPT